MQELAIVQKGMGSTSTALPRAYDVLNNNIFHSISFEWSAVRVT